MFKIEAAVCLGYTAAACTSEACKWNVDFVKRIPGVKIKDAVFYKSRKNPEPTSKLSVGMTDQSQSGLLARLSALKQRDQPVVLSTFGNFSKLFCPKSPVPNIPKLPKSLRDLYSPHHLNDCDFSTVYQEEISEEDKEFIERSTREQGNSLLWYSIRVGRITASVAHSVLHTNMDSPSASVLLKFVCQGKEYTQQLFPGGKIMKRRQFNHYLWSCEKCTKMSA